MKFAYSYDICFCDALRDPCMSIQDHLLTHEAVSSCRCRVEPHCYPPWYWPCYGQCLLIIVWSFEMHRYLSAAFSFTHRLNWSISKEITPLLLWWMANKIPENAEVHSRKCKQGFTLSVFLPFLANRVHMPDNHWVCCGINEEEAISVYKVCWCQGGLRQAWTDEGLREREDKQKEGRR